jgi:hypothetical protein
MSNSKVNVFIKSQGGARVKTIENTVTSMAQNGTLTQNTDAILIHVGINNISEADSPTSIADDFRDLIDTVKLYAPQTKIILSSILPKKRDKLSFERSSDVNETLYDICQENGYTFIDNTNDFITDKSLYLDEVHLNPKGGAALGKNFNQAISRVLQITEESTESHFQQGSHRETKNHHWNNHQPRMRTRSPWKGPQSQWNRPQSHQTHPPPFPWTQIPSTWYQPMTTQF